MADIRTGQSGRGVGNRPVEPMPENLGTVALAELKPAIFV
jgi:hypothetical protein